MVRRLLLAALAAVLCGPVVALRAQGSTLLSKSSLVMPYAEDTAQDSVPQIALEVRFVTVTDELAERLSLKVGHGERRLLDDKQVRDLFNRVQSDYNTNIMQTPKLTMVDGQQCFVDVGDTLTFTTGYYFIKNGSGLTLTPVKTAIEDATNVSIRPKLSSDHRSIHIDLNVEITDLAPGPVTDQSVELPESARGASMDGKELKNNKLQIQMPVMNVRFKGSYELEIPDGQTALLEGQKSVFEVRDAVPPMLDKIPYIECLFKPNYHQATGYMFMMITPRVIIPEEEIRCTGFTNSSPGQP